MKIRYDEMIMEQFELNFGDDQEMEKSLYEMTKEELKDKYREKIGVSPRVGMTESDMRYAIAHPETERNKLREDARKEDSEDLKTTYQSKPFSK